MLLRRCRKAKAT